MISVMNIGFYLIISGLCNVQSQFIEYCPVGDPCSAPPTGGTFGTLATSPPANCSEDEITCYLDGCTEICREPRCVVPLSGDETTTPSDECECYYYETYEDICPEGQRCCHDDYCTSVCKEIRYAKAVCPDDKPPLPLSLLECLKLRCLLDIQCPSFQFCCPGYCPLFDVCRPFVYKRAVCPSDSKTKGNKKKPTPCDTDRDCVDNDQLCCRLNSNTNDTYCREPEYVDDDIRIFVVG